MGEMLCWGAGKLDDAIVFLGLLKPTPSSTNSTNSTNSTSIEPI
jgi:hypothetical protein